MSSTRACVGAAAESTTARSSASVTTARGCTWVSRPASSSGVPVGSVGTDTAPRLASASQTSTYGGVVRAVTHDQVAPSYAVRR